VTSGGSRRALLLAALMLAGQAVTASNYAVVVTGGELLDGSISDAHTPFLARALRPLGLRCVQSTVVDDVADDMRAALEEAAARAPLVLITGGLGPTANDITREVLSGFTGLPLEEHPEALIELGRRFDQAPSLLPDNLRRQARVPTGGDYLPNSRGTAVGLIFKTETLTIVALPGPPRELQPMVQESLVPWLRRRLGLPESGSSITLRFVGIGQSAIDRVLREHDLVPPRVVVSSRFEGSRVDFTFSLPEATPEAGDILERLRQGAQNQLGEHLYAVGATSLEQVALEHLRPYGNSLVLVEVHGPRIAAALTSAATAGGMTLHSFAATGLEELWRDVPPLRESASTSPPSDPLLLLTRSAKAASQASWAIGLGPAIRTDNGQAALVPVVVVAPDGGVVHWRLGLRESPETGWTSLLNDLLDRLRKLDPRRLEQQEDQ